MLHRKRTLEQLLIHQQEQAELYCKNDHLDLAIQLIQEQQDLIKKMSRNLSNARKANKQAHKCIERLSTEISTNNNTDSRYYKLYVKATQKIIQIEKTLRLFGLELHQKSLSELIETHEENEKILKAYGLK